MMLEAISADMSKTGAMSALATEMSSTAPANIAGPNIKIDFDKAMSDAASSAINTLKMGEAASISGVQGKASAQQVVEAIMSAEQTLHMTIAVRDKVVQAYQEISRMAI